MCTNMELTLYLQKSLLCQDGQVDAGNLHGYIHPKNDVWSQAWNGVCTQERLIVKHSACQLHRTRSIWSFFRNTVQTQAPTYTHIHSPLSTHTRTPYLYEHVRKTEPTDWILKLTKSPHASCCRRECPLNDYSVFMRHTDIKPMVWTLVDWGYNHPTSGWFSTSVRVSDISTMQIYVPTCAC
jgi:hypothetical protein